MWSGTIPGNGCPKIMIHTAAYKAEGSCPVDPGPLGGPSGFLLNETERWAYRALPAIVFLKTHKTVSSSLESKQASKQR